jgi:protocatechuate 3,4-dioxygenase, alpha subunit
VSGEPGLEPTPSQTIGPFFHDALLERDLTELVSPDHPGAISISGLVYDGAGEPVTDAMVEISQAGPVSFEEDPNTLDGGFSDWGRSGTSDGGRFSFVTLKPAPVPDADGTPQAPHVNVVVFARGLLRQVVTRLYFPDEGEANAGDPVLSSIEDAGLRETLVARNEGGGAYRFDVRLQGEGQTAFFEFAG